MLCKQCWLVTPGLNLFNLYKSKIKDNYVDLSESDHLAEPLKCTYMFSRNVFHQTEADEKKYSEKKSFGCATFVIQLMKENLSLQQVNCPEKKVTFHTVVYLQQFLGRIRFNNNTLYNFSRKWSRIRCGFDCPLECGMYVPFLLAFLSSSCTVLALQHKRSILIMELNSPN